MHALSLHFIHLNFSCRHQTLKGATLAMAAGIERYPWALTQIAELIDPPPGVASPDNVPTGRRALQAGRVIRW
jgi:hypothetical protein